MDPSSPFSIDFWYPIFKENTVKTRFVPIDDSFTQYMLSDGVILPKADHYTREDPRLGGTFSDDSENEDIGEVIEEEEYRFSDIERSILDILDDFDCECFVRSNWSSAKDASWVLGSLKCTTPGHVFLLMKSSNRIVSDYEQISKMKIPPVLALQRWCNYYPSMEFCLYICNYKLIAISQKDSSLFYPFLVTARDSIGALLCEFVETRVKDRFPVADMEMDVYVDKKDKVWVVNINAFDEEMNTSLFSYEELLQLKEKEGDVEFRVVEEENETPVSDQLFFQLPMEMQTLSDDKIEEFIHNLKKEVYCVCTKHEVTTLRQTFKHAVGLFCSLDLLRGQRAQIGN